MVIWYCATWHLPKEKVLDGPPAAIVVPMIAVRVPEGNCLREGCVLQQKVVESLGPKVARTDNGIVHVNDRSLQRTKKELARPIPKIFIVTCVSEVGHDVGRRPGTATGTTSALSVVGRGGREV